jgi:hypothetical protein
MPELSNRFTTCDDVTFDIENIGKRNKLSRVVAVGLVVVSVSEGILGNPLGNAMFTGHIALGGSIYIINNPPNSQLDILPTNVVITSTGVASEARLGYPFLANIDLVDQVGDGLAVVALVDSGKLLCSSQVCLGSCWKVFVGKKVDIHLVVFVITDGTFEVNTPTRTSNITVPRPRRLVLVRQNVEVTFGATRSSNRDLILGAVTSLSTVGVKDAGVS